MMNERKHPQILARNTVPAVDVSLDPLAAHWFVSLDQASPGWRALFDHEAIGLALSDVAGGRGVRTIKPFYLDLLAEFIVQAHTKRPAALRAANEIFQNDAVLRAVQEGLPLFLASTGSSLATPELRLARANALRVFFSALSKPLRRVLRRLANAMEERESYEIEGLVSLEEDGAFQVSPDPTPPDLAAAREAVPRIFSHLDREFTPRAMAAFRAYMRDPVLVTASQAGQAAGVSDATLSRIRHAFAVHVERECSISSRAESRAFLTALEEFLSKVA